MNFTNIVKGLMGQKRSVFSRLVDSDDNTVSASTVFMLITAVIAIFLLVMPTAAIIVELIYSHTVTMSWGDIAAYIGSVSTILLSGGFLKGWTNYSTYKFKDNNGNGIPDDEEECPEDTDIPNE